MTRLLSTIILAGAFGACSPKLSGSSPLFTNRWVLETLNGVPVQTSGSDQDAHLQFVTEGNKLTGSGGCNRLNGNFEADGKNKLKFSPLATTRMACQDLAFEERFIEELNKTRRYGFDGEGKLQLKDEKGNLLAVFVKR